MILATLFYEECKINKDVALEAIKKPRTQTSEKDASIIFFGIKEGSARGIKLILSCENNPFYLSYTECKLVEDLESLQQKVAVFNTHNDNMNLKVTATKNNRGYDITYLELVQKLDPSLVMTVNCLISYLKDLMQVADVEFGMYDYASTLIPNSYKKER